MSYNTNYTVRLYESKSNLGLSQGNRLIEAMLPGQVALNIRTNYKPFSQGMATGALKNALSTLGISLTYKWLDMNIWDETQPIELTIPFNLVARKDARSEVYLPILRLLGLASPAVLENTGAMIPPGVDILQTLADGVGEVINKGLSSLTAGQPNDGKNVTDTEWFGKKGEFNNYFVEALSRTLNRLNVFKWGVVIRKALVGNNSANLWGRTVDLELGQILKFNKMIITNLAITIGRDGASIMPVNSTGFPIMATVVVTLKATEVFTVTGSGSYTSDAQYNYASRGASRDKSQEKAASSVAKSVSNSVGVASVAKYGS